MADWVELRVHGVSGTPPESMLATPHVVQVAGDDRSRSFRPADALGRELRGADGHVIEAFHWGRWTSGSWTKALWLLLIPFGIVNAAQFMLPRPETPTCRRAHTGSGAALRLVALVLTVLLSVGACVVVVDLVTWQWLGRRDIRVPDWLLVALALVGTTAVVFLLSWIGQSKQRAHYRFRHARPDVGRQDEPPGLDDAPFFDGNPDNPTLRRLHRTAAFSVVALTGFAIAADRGPRWATWSWWAALAILGVTAGIVLVLGDPEDTTSVRAPRSDPREQARQEHRRDAWHGRRPEPGEVRGRDRRSWRAENGTSGVVAVVLLGLAALSVAGAVFAVVWADVTTPGPLAARDEGVPGMDQVAAYTGIVGTVAVALLFVTVAGLAWSTRNAPALHPYRRFARGMAPALAAAVGFFTGIGLTAGVALSVQGSLNRLRDDTAERIDPLLRGALDIPDPYPAVAAPAVLQRVSYAWGITAVILVVLGGMAWWKVRRRRGDRYVRRVRRAMTFGGVERLPASWRPRVAGAIGAARLKNNLVGVMVTFAVGGLVLAVAAALGQARSYGMIGSGWTWAYEWLTGVTSLPGDPVSGDDLVIGAGQFTLVTLAGGVVLLVRGAIRAEGARRGISVVWDVIAFWPRSVHPFVPPPYAQEVVPALVRRICWHLGIADPLRDDGAEEPTPDPALNPDSVETVVVAAHSQGSLIALAALLWLPPEAQTRVRWLTFGSQLRQQFPRAFPHYVTVDLLRDAQRTHGWLSLYRDTDPIAGPVTSWCHSQDAGGYTSHRLEGPPGPQPDEVVPSTGRRVCGREWRLLDPVPLDVELQRRAVATIRGHSDYWLGPDWEDALCDVRAQVPSPGPAAPPAAG